MSLLSLPLDVLFSVVCNFLTIVDLCSLRLTCRELNTHLTTPFRTNQLAPATRTLRLRNRTRKTCQLTTRLPVFCSLQIKCSVYDNTGFFEYACRVLEQNPTVSIQNVTLYDGLVTNLAFKKAMWRSHALCFSDKSFILSNSSLCQHAVSLHLSNLKHGQLSTFFGSTLVELFLDSVVRMDDLSCLTHLPSLRHLRLRSSLIDALPCIQQCSFVSVDNCPHLRDIKGLFGVPVVQISYCSVLKDLSPLIRARRVSFDCCENINLEPLKQIPALELSFMKTQILTGDLQNPELSIKRMEGTIASLCAFRYCLPNKAFLECLTSNVRKWKDVEGHQYVSRLTMYEDEEMDFDMDFECCHGLKILTLSSFCWGIKKDLKLPSCLTTLYLEICCSISWTADVFPASLSFVSLTSIPNVTDVMLFALSNIKTVMCTAINILSLRTMLASPECRIRHLRLERCLGEISIARHSLWCLEIIDCPVIHPSILALTANDFPNGFLLSLCKTET